MSNTPKKTCFLAPNLLNKADMIVIGHPSNPIVHSLSLTKSIASLHSPGDVGLGTMCTWLHSFATDISIISKSKSIFICFIISACFSGPCCRGGRRFLPCSHFVSSTSIFISGKLAGLPRTVVEKISLYSLHSDLSLVCSSSDPSI